MSWSKVRALVRAVRRGEKIPPVLVQGKPGSGALLTGVHRSAANDLIILLAEKNDVENPTLIPWESYDPDSASEELRAAVDCGDFEAIDTIVDRESPSNSSG